jgi:SRSO17 transposase
MIVMDAAAQGRLKGYFDDVGSLLEKGARGGGQARRASFAKYAFGLLADGERKSIEPIAARSCADPKQADAAHQSLHHFVGTSAWSDCDVRRFSARYALQEINSRERVEAWIVDDTGFLKQGKHSVGVQRQYTGSAGKIANCQIGVSLSVATRTEHLPVDFELYLPESWATDADLRRQAHIPDEVSFKTKPQLALDMIQRAVDDGVPPGVVLGDAAFGSTDFRRGVRVLGLHYGVGIEPQTRVWEIGTAIQRGGASVGVKELAFKLRRARKFRRCTWRAGTKEDLTAKFAVVSVRACVDDKHEADTRETLWLVIEWRDGEDEPANYFLSSLPASTRKKPLIRLLMQRWRTERVYEDLKGELGLDHFEGRSFRGWHHHISVVLCCYAFVIAERVRRFPPSARGKMAHAAHQDAA